MCRWALRCARAAHRLAAADGATTPPIVAQEMITKDDVYVDDAIKTPQFWLIWWVLCLNVTAGIGVISMASPMLQDIFGAKPRR